MESILPNLYIRSLNNNINQVWDLINKLICKELGISFQSLHKSLKTDDEGFQYNNYLFVIRADDISRIKYIVEQVCLISKRHYVVIKIVERLRHNNICALMSLIKKYSATTVFIFIDNQFHPVPLCIQSLLFRIVIKSKGEEKRKCTSCETFILNNIQKLYELYKKPQCTAVTYFKELRTFCVKISAGCIPISKLAEYILQWKADSEIVSFLADLDVALKKTSKELFALEYYIQLIIDHCVKNDL